MSVCGLPKTGNNNSSPNLQGLAGLWCDLAWEKARQLLSRGCALWGKTANEQLERWKEVGGFVEGFFESTVGLRFRSFVCVGGSSFCFALRRGGLEFVFT